MSERQSNTDSDAYVPTYPFATAMAVGYSAMLVITGSLFLAVWVSRAELRAVPPQLPWQFMAVFSAGAWGCTFLQLALLYHFKDRRFWPQTAKQWLQRVGPAVLLIATAALPAAMHGWNPTVAMAAASLILGIAGSMVPTFLCFSDWLKHRIGRMEETIQLQLVEKSELPRSVRSYFEVHTDELNRMGFDLLGDYRLKKYTPTYARFFLNRERDTFAEICHSRLALMPLRAVCFFSLTPDGCYLESSNSRLGKSRQTRLFELQILPSVVTRDVAKQHVERLRELDRDHARMLKDEELERVIHYGNKKLYDLMIGDGLVLQNPYADFDESVLVPSDCGIREMDAAIFDSELEPDVTLNA